ncbi:MAG: apolipoprotein N-acyltransferase [Candidatus Binatia bacterium]
MTSAPLRRHAVALVLVAASGWLCAQAYPDRGASELAWVALVPFLVVLRGATPAACAFAGLVWMLVFAWGINDWFPRAVARYLDQPLAVGLLFFLGVTIGSAAPASMLFASLYGRWGRRACALAPAAAAATWVGTEFLRARLLGDPWGLLGYSQASRPAWIQIADLAGVYGVGFVVLLVNAVLAEFLVAAAGTGPRRRVLATGLATLVIVPGLTLAYGDWRLRDFAQVDGQRTLDVTLVQGNLALEDQWLPSMQKANLDRYLELTREALVDADANLVVWPENAVTFFLQDSPQRRASIAEVLEPSGSMLVAGGPHAVRGPDPVYYNSAYLLGSDGAIRARYDKQRLLPFGEFQPTRVLGLVASRFDVVREFSPGADAATTLDLGGILLGVVICNEAMFPEPASERAAAGVQALLVLTNDSWVGERNFADQALHKAMLRAVEQRRWMARSSTSGPSAIVDAGGRIVARSGHGEAAVLRGRIALLETPTVYAAVGDAFAWLCVAAAGVLAVRRETGGDTVA